MSEFAEIPVRLYVMQLRAISLPTPNGVLEMSEGCYLVQTNQGRNILIDSGLPADYVPPTGVVPASYEKNVLVHLADLDLKPSDVQTVICTHFDIDHVGFHPSFSQAEFVVQRAQYESAFGGYPRYVPSRPYWDNPAVNYRLVDGDSELLSGFRLLYTPGHAPGHQSVLLRLPHTGAVLLAIDAVVMKRLFSPNRTVLPTDDNQEELRASTEKLQAVVDREQVGLVIFGHDGEQWRTLKKAPDYYD